MKYLIVAIAISLSACSGGSNSNDVGSLDFELCLDQGGEWSEGQCFYEDDKGYSQAFCKQDAEHCPVID